jgi:uncharacterized membrane protein YgdD (TMEM256/DUF423 family)
MQKRLLSIAAICGALAVILGAFGAHTLKAILSTESLQTFETGVRYQFYHTFAILATALLVEKSPKSLIAGYFFLAGIIMFSGSLYLLAIRSTVGIEGWAWLGPVTPLGGLMFIIGWIILLFSALKKVK